MTANLPAAIEPRLRQYLAKQAKLIKRWVVKSAIAFIAVGKHLAEVRAKLKEHHGVWLDWLKREFPQWHQSHAYRLIEIAADFGHLESSQIEKFAPSAMYALVGSKAARDEAIDRVSTGEHISHATAQQLLAKHRAIDEELTADEQEEAVQIGEDYERAKA